MTQRLTVRSITSIGAVEEGDNGPHSSIIFWKAKPLTNTEAENLLRSLRIEQQRRQPSTTRKDIETEILRKRPDIEAALRGSGSDQGPGSESAAAVQKRIAANLAATAKTDAKIQKTLAEIHELRRTAMPKQEGRTAAVILAEVSTLATRIQKSAGEPMTKAQARAEVWKIHPELVTEVRKAQAREKDDGKEIVAEIDRIMKSYALSISATPENMAKTLTQIRSGLYQTAAGREIRNLRTAAAAGKVASEGEIAKSAEYADAWSVLKGWDPRG